MKEKLLMKDKYYYGGTRLVELMLTNFKVDIICNESSNVIDHIKVLRFFL